MAGEISRFCTVDEVTSETFPNTMGGTYGLTLRGVAHAPCGGGLVHDCEEFDPGGARSIFVILKRGLFPWSV